jgi:hypothetical protein
MIQSNSAAPFGLGSPAARAGLPHADVPDALFIELLNAYRSRGGLARASEVTARVVSRRPVGIAWIEQCFAHRLLVSVIWHSMVWLPLFQFERSDMTLRDEVFRTCGELRDVMDDCEMAAWFVHPQCGLNHCSPLDMLDSRPELVVEAARREHFLQGV